MVTVRTHYDACRILGIKPNASREEWKSAYRRGCKMYHPDEIDVQDDKKAEKEVMYEQICAAYTFLESEYEHAKVRIIDNSKPVSKPKIIGSPLSLKESNEAKRRRNEIEEKIKKEKAKKEKMQIIQQKAKEIRQKEKEDRILDEIRWIRVAEIIRKTMQEDAKRKKLEEEIAKKY